MTYSKKAQWYIDRNMWVPLSAGKPEKGEVVSIILRGIRRVPAWIAHDNFWRWASYPDNYIADYPDGWFPIQVPEGDVVLKGGEE